MLTKVETFDNIEYVKLNYYFKVLLMEIMLWKKIEINVLVNLLL